ncbi:MAG TPA: GrpB family protein [Spirochaetota bacterium]|nr:GrpB family protein [Spirochaetota bacterium]
MTTEELGLLYPIILTPHNPEWRFSFDREKSALLEGLDPLRPLRIEHIGSTAVRGIAAKPTIDILIAIPDDPASVQTFQDKMMIMGYVKTEEQKKHQMFVKGYTPEGLADESFHVHMGPLSLDWLWDRVYFRDYLNEFPEVAAEYESLKMRLAEKFRNDREAYTDGKGDFIRRITDAAKNHYGH